MEEHGHLKIMPAGVTAGIQVLTQPLRNDAVDYDGLLFRRDTIFRRPAEQGNRVKNSCSDEALRGSRHPKRRPCGGGGGNLCPALGGSG
jgi:hypothetical protein